MFLRERLRCVESGGTAAKDPAFGAAARHHVEVRDLSALVGTEVRRLCFGYQVTLDLVGEGVAGAPVSAALQIEAPIRLERVDGEVECDPNEKASHGPLTALLRLVVTEATIDESETLRLSFDDGTAIAVPRDPNYESWNLTGEGVPQLLMGTQ